MKNKWFAFMKQNGFLIFLFISVLVVAGATILVATENLRIARDPQEDELVILDEIKEEPDAPDIQVSKQEEPLPEVAEEEVAETIDEKEFEAVEEPEIAQEVSTSTDEIEYIDDYEDVQEVDNKAMKWMLPIEGKILTEYSIDKLVFSKTLEEWRAHTGLDIAANIGDKVKAPGDGVIKQIKEDDLWGITIIIDHGNGMESRLSNLGTMELVREGLEVKIGDDISTVGDTASIEMTMESHIHYEVFKDGKIIDPRSITN